MNTDTRNNIINDIANIFDENCISIINWNEISNEPAPIIQEGGEKFTYVLESIDYEGVWGIRVGIDPGYMLFEEISDENLDKIYKTIKHHLCHRKL